GENPDGDARSRQRADRRGRGPRTVGAHHRGSRAQPDFSRQRSARRVGPRRSPHRFVEARACQRRRSVDGAWHHPHRWCARRRARARPGRMGGEPADVQRRRCRPHGTRLARGVARPFRSGGQGTSRRDRARSERRAAARLSRHTGRARRSVLRSSSAFQNRQKDRAELSEFGSTHRRSDQALSERRLTLRFATIMHLMNSRTGKAVLWVIAVAVLAMTVGGASTVSAQVFTGRIDITIEDATGGRLPGVNVDLTGPVTQSQVSDAEGQAHFLNLAVGTYTVKASLSGFNAFTNSNVHVATGAGTPLAI